MTINNKGLTVDEATGLRGGSVAPVSNQTNLFQIHPEQPADREGLALVINVSGGKDSTAMLSDLCERYPKAQKFAVWADTGWEHEGAEAWIQSMVGRFGLELHTVRNPNKTYLEMVEGRGMFPASSTRQCTSDLKRGPVQKWVRQAVKAGVIRADTIANCLGLRAEESPGRAKRPVWGVNRSMSKAGRKVFDFHPILRWSLADVLALHEARGLPLHPVYRYLGRFSCRVCIFNSKSDLQAIRENDPEAFQIISDLEQKIDFTMRGDGSLLDLTKPTEVE